MSDAGGARAAAAAALSPRARAILALALAGLLLGFLWGVADVPRYTASATVLVEGGGGDPADEAALGAAVQTAESEEVANRAAGLIGGDVSGADLLSDVDAAADPGAGAVRIEAEADSPDFAAAAADGYALALVDVGGKKFEAGAAASIPGEPSDNRSALRWSLLGLLAGLLVGIGAVAFNARSRRAADSDRPRSSDPERRPERRREPETLRAGDAFGAPVLARLSDPEALLRFEDGALEVDRAAADAFAGLAGGLGIAAGAEGPRLISVVDAGAEDGGLEVMVGLAIAAAGLGVRAIAVEADLGEPRLADRVGVASSPGLRDYLRGVAGPREVLRSAPVRAGGEGNPLVCVPAGEPDASPPAGVGGERFAALLERLPRVYDLVLVLGPPAGTEEAEAIAGLVDGVVLVSADVAGASSRIADAVDRLRGSWVLAGVLTGTDTAQYRRQSDYAPTSRVSR